MDVNMKREAFLDKLNPKRNDDLYTTLKAGYNSIGTSGFWRITPGLSMW